MKEVKYMELHVYLKGKSDPQIFKGDRIDVLDLDLEGNNYKQIRYFKKGFSKSELIQSDIILKIKKKFK